MHFLSDHRTTRLHPGRVPRADGESYFRVRYLPRLEWLLGLTEADFRELFRGSALKRTKWRGLLRNSCIAVGNSGLRRGMADHARICGTLEQLAASEDHVIAESARWALLRIQ